MPDSKPDVDLRGKVRPGVSLSPSEMQALKKQGLVDEGTGKLRPAALIPPSSETTKGRKRKAVVPIPVPLVQADPEAARALDETIGQLKQADLESLKKMMLGPALEPPPAEPAPEVSTMAGLTEPDAATAIARSSRPVACPQCGWDHRLKFQSPACEQEDKAAFLRHLLSRNSAGRFFKEYPIVDGSIRVRFRSRTDEENVAIWEQVKRDVLSEKEGGAGRLLNEMEMQLQFLRYQLISSLDRISGVDVPETFPSILEGAQPGEKDWLHKQYKSRLGGSQPAIWYNILVAKFLEFERLYSWLASRAYEPDFWKPAAGAV